MASYCIQVTLAHGEQYDEARNVIDEQAAAVAHTLITSLAARQGLITRVTITLGDSGAIWEWQYGRGVVSE